MTIFAEPSETLCGLKHPSKHAICSRSVDDNGRHIVYTYDDEVLQRAPELKVLETDDHVWVSAIDIFRALDSTFTPCKFYHKVYNG